ncbi:hypothetical protein [Streptomyces hyaluromycini]|nr:hypothetical protein [Streptomyces hyaluromycini]
MSMPLSQERGPAASEPMVCDAELDDPVRRLRSAAPASFPFGLALL